MNRRYETFVRQNNDIYSEVYSNYKHFYYKDYSIKLMNTFNKFFFASLAKQARITGSSKIFKDFCIQIKTRHE